MGRKRENNLKPCPFCGSGLIRPFYDAKDFYVTGIHCFGCGASVKWDIKMDTGQYFSDIMQEWEDKWNARSN